MRYHKSCQVHEAITVLTCFLVTVQRCRYSYIKSDRTFCWVKIQYASSFKSKTSDHAFSELTKELFMWLKELPHVN